MQRFHTLDYTTTCNVFLFFVSLTVFSSGLPVLPDTRTNPQGHRKAINLNTQTTELRISRLLRSFRGPRRSVLTDLNKRSIHCRRGNQRNSKPGQSIRKVGAHGRSAIHRPRALAEAATLKEPGWECFGILRDRRQEISSDFSELNGG